MVYLIHMDAKLHHAQHYLGFVKRSSYRARLNHHQNGSGARMLNAVNQHNIPYGVVRTWPEGDRTLERRLKNQKNAPHLCPICSFVKKYERDPAAYEGDELMKAIREHCRSLSRPLRRSVAAKIYQALGRANDWE